MSPHKSIVTLLFFTALVAIGTVSSQDDLDYYEGFSPPVTQEEDPFGCNVTICSAPCPNSPPSYGCPARIPQCRTGCACRRDCERNVIYCFMIRYCTDMKRVFTKRRRIVSRADANVTVA